MSIKPEPYSVPDQKQFTDLNEMLDPGKLKGKMITIGEDGKPKLVYINFLKRIFYKLFKPETLRIHYVAEKVVGYLSKNSYNLCKNPINFLETLKNKVQRQSCNTATAEKINKLILKIRDIDKDDKNVALIDSEGKKHYINRDKLNIETLKDRLASTDFLSKQIPLPHTAETIERYINYYYGLENLEAQRCDQFFKLADLSYYLNDKKLFNSLLDRAKPQEDNFAHILEHTYSRSQYKELFDKTVAWLHDYNTYRQHYDINKNGDVWIYWATPRISQNSLNKIKELPLKLFIALADHPDMNSSSFDRLFVQRKFNDKEYKEEIDGKSLEQLFDRDRNSLRKIFHFKGEIDSENTSVSFKNFNFHFEKKKHNNEFCVVMKFDNTPKFNFWYKITTITTWGAENSYRLSYDLSRPHKHNYDQKWLLEGFPYKIPLYKRCSAIASVKCEILMGDSPREASVTKSGDSLW